LYNPAYSPIKPQTLHQFLIQEHRWNRKHVCPNTQLLIYWGPKITQFYMMSNRTRNFLLNKTSYLKEHHNTTNMWFISPKTKLNTKNNVYYTDYTIVLPEIENSRQNPIYCGVLHLRTRKTVLCLKIAINVLKKTRRKN